MPILMEKEEEGMLSPILAHGGVRFMWIKHNNLYRIPAAGQGLGGDMPAHWHRTAGQPEGTSLGNAKYSRAAEQEWGTAGPKGGFGWRRVMLTGFVFGRGGLIVRGRGGEVREVGSE